MKKLLFVALAAVGMTACVQSEELVLPKSTATIAFDNAYVYNATKADPTTTTTSLEAFDVWAYMKEVAGTVLTDEDVTKVGGKWGYANLQYWMPSQTYYFAALAPMNSTNVKETLAGDPDAQLGLGTIEFTNVDGTEDLLYAKAKVTTPELKGLTENGMEPVKFQFQHLLSKVKFTFQNGFTTSNMKVVVKNVQMSAPKAGSINLAVADYTEGWVLGDETIDLQFGNVAELAATASAAAADERLTIPATGDYIKTYNVKFDVEVYSGSVKALETSKEATISGYALEMGKAYNFTAVIDWNTLALPAIEFTAAVTDWDTATEEIPVGYYVAADGSYVVASEVGLQQITEGINAGEIPADTNIVLGGDIDLALTPASRSIVSNWTPIGTEAVPFTGVIDGQGYTISNLTLVEKEAKEGKAYIGFIGYGKNVTVKNVTFENVTINIPCLDIDHAQGHIGAVAGSLEGNSTIEDVTVKGDIKVEATQTANGASRVAVVAGGNAYGNVTIKNVHVIANEGSYLIANNNTGAIAGQLQGKTVYENCTSNINVTVNKFFAGGIVGLAGTNDKFINCHTTGNIAVVAGREGRANDHYRVGGIAGGWADGKNNVLTLENCSYTGTVSGVNADGSVAEVLDYMGYVGRGYTLTNCAGSKVVIDGVEFIQAYDNVYGVYYYEGAIIDVNGVKALVYNVANGSVKAVSVEELNLNGKNWQNAIDWATGLGENWALASIYELDAIHTARVALNKVLSADNANNALFEEDDYIEPGKYAIYLSSTEATGNDPQGEAYFANRVLVKYFNLNGYWDYPYSTFASINKSAPLRSNYFARATITLK